MEWKAPCCVDCMNCAKVMRLNGRTTVTFDYEEVNFDIPEDDLQAFQCTGYEKVAVGGTDPD